VAKEDQEKESNMAKLRAGIIGLKEGGEKLLAGLAMSERFEVQAIADRDMELAKKVGAEYGVEPYDDYRRLIVQEKPGVLFLAVPTYQCGECIQLAAKAGTHIYKESPLARSLPEAVQWLDLMQKSGKKFHVGAVKRFHPAYQKAHQLVEEEQIGTVYLVRAEVFFKIEGDFGWRGDPVLSGGGVLLEMAYAMIDQVVWNKGAPERLYSLNTDKCSKRVLPPSRTEDTAVLTMMFPDGTMGNVLCGWMTEPSGERLILHGTEGTIELDRDVLRWLDSAGNVVLKKKYSCSEAELTERQIEYFADLLTDPEVKSVSDGGDHLVNVAIIESAYLSGRTQLPENLKVYGSLFDV